MISANDQKEVIAKNIFTPFLSLFVNFNLTIEDKQLEKSGKFMPTEFFLADLLVRKSEEKRVENLCQLNFFG